MSILPKNDRVWKTFSRQSRLKFCKNLVDCKGKSVKSCKFSVNFIH